MMCKTKLYTIGGVFAFMKESILRMTELKTIVGPRGGEMKVKNPSERPRPIVRGYAQLSFCQSRTGGLSSSDPVLLRRFN